MSFEQNKNILRRAGAGLLIFAFFILLAPQAGAAGQKARFWQFQAIDTMKYSRDLARERTDDAAFDAVIDAQVKAIAETGATHLAVATPYDKEFLPFLARWVAAARRYNLGVWFRGNWSGWEGWFDYKRISRTQHLLLTEDFVLDNPDLFQDGDVFSSCPECENGGPGDPRRTGDTAGHRQFIVAEYEIVKNVFARLHKNVAANYFSMNGDVARLVMDRDTTARLDDIVTIDHYVKTPEILARDVRSLAEASGGKIVLGEYGFPIPDIHGTATEARQAEWLEDFFSAIVGMPEIVGVSYWTNVGGSTAIWDSGNEARPAVAVVKKYYSPPVVTGFVKDEADKPVSPATVKNQYTETISDESGYFEIPVVEDKRSEIKIDAPGFSKKIVYLQKPAEGIEVRLEHERPSFWTRVIAWLKNIFRRRG